MEKQAYMTAAGAWAGNWYDGTPAPSVLIPAPAGGRYGWRWDGAAWAEDDGAEAEVEAVLQPPEQRLAADRAGMVADVWQLRAALDLTDPNLWPMIEGYARGTLAIEGVPPCDPVSRAAILYAVTVPRLSESIDLLAFLLSWDGGQVDALFREAMGLRR